MIQGIKSYTFTWCFNIGSLKVISPIQQIYNNWSLIKSREAGVKSVLEILNLSIKKYSNTNKNCFSKNSNNFIEIKKPKI